jgi:hypothetical protein
VQAVVAGHETPVSVPADRTTVRTGDTCGAGWIDQLLPSQRSTSAWPPYDPPEPVDPTAMQAVVDAHETP